MTLLPDSEIVVTRWLAGRLPDAVVATTLVGWRAGQPHVMVRRTGGTARYGWVDDAQIQLEVRAAARRAAAALAQLARASMAVMPAMHTDPDVHVVTTTETAGPAWVPAPDSDGSWRLSWTVTSHPIRAAGRGGS